MRFTWDPAKREENLTSRGFDFAFASEVFDGVHVDYPDDRRDYGEMRLIALGIADGLALTVVCADRVDSDGSTVRRIISARWSDRKERERHAAATQVQTDTRPR